MALEPIRLGRPRCPLPCRGAGTPLHGGLAASWRTLSDRRDTRTTSRALRLGQQSVPWASETGQAQTVRQAGGCPPPPAGHRGRPCGPSRDWLSTQEGTARGHHPQEQGASLPGTAASVSPPPPSNPTPLSVCPAAPPGEGGGPRGHVQMPGVPVFPAPSQHQAERTRASPPPRPPGRPPQNTLSCLCRKGRAAASGASAGPVDSVRAEKRLSRRASAARPGGGGRPGRR